MDSVEIFILIFERDLILSNDSDANIFAAPVKYFYVFLPVSEARKLAEKQLTEARSMAQDKCSLQ